MSMSPRSSLSIISLKKLLSKIVGAVSGIASLGSDAKHVLAELRDESMLFLGEYDIAGGTPADGDKKDVYRLSGVGTLLVSGETLAAGDYIIYDGSAWIPLSSIYIPNNWLAANNGANFATAPVASKANAIAVGNNVSVDHINSIGIGTNLVVLDEANNSPDNLRLVIGSDNSMAYGVRYPVIMLGQGLSHAPPNALGGTAGVDILIGEDLTKTFSDAGAVLIGAGWTAAGRGVAIGASVNNSSTLGGNAIAIIGGQVGSASVAQDSILISRQQTQSGQSAVLVGVGGGSPPGNNSVGVGNINGTLGFASVGVGNSVTASGTAAIAAGNGVSVSGSSAVGIGTNQTVSGTEAVCVGHDSDATGSYAIAFGPEVIASGLDSIGIGREMTVNAASTAIGRNTGSATATFVTAVGHRQLPPSTGTNLVLLGAGGGGQVNSQNYSASISVGNNNNFTTRTIAGDNLLSFNGYDGNYSQGAATSFIGATSSYSFSTVDATPVSLGGSIVGQGMRFCSAGGLAFLEVDVYAEETVSGDPYVERIQCMIKTTSTGVHSFVGTPVHTVILNPGAHSPTIALSLKHADAVLGVDITGEVGKNFKGSCNFTGGLRRN